MFVGDEVVLDVSVAAARAGLVNLARGGQLMNASEGAYDSGIGGRSQIAALGLSKLVRVQMRELTQNGEAARLAIRWEATGPGSGLFPVLDADITVLPAGEHTTVLSMAGVYRPPLGPVGEALDRAILHRVAAATIRNFLGRVAGAIIGQPGPAACSAAPSPPLTA